jgi:molecular chaperone GrpE
MTDETNPHPDGSEQEAAPAENGQAAPEAAPEAAPATAGASQALEAAQAKAAEYLEGWQRARAEFANYRRRIEREQAETHQNATARVIGRWLDVLDDFDRAMQDRPDPDDPKAVARWMSGIELIYRKLQNILDAEGVERIEAAGQQFDPQRHEAIGQEDSDAHEPGEITGVVRQGYRIGDKIIRPAMVRVAR